MLSKLKQKIKNIENLLLMALFDKNKKYEISLININNVILLRQN
jgi:hypothetical protein